MHFLRYQLPKLDNNRLIHSLKTAIAFLIGMFIVRVFDLPAQGQWVLITLLVVMCAQSRVGAIMQKSYMRFLGTLLGACIAALTLLLAYPSVVWTTLILCLTTALFSYIADSPGYLSEAGPLGAVTIVIILVGQNPSYLTALARFFEISLGILIALLVSRFVFPLHSRTQLRTIVKNTLEDLKVLSDQLKLLASPEVEKTYESYADKVIGRFASQNKLYDEVMRESFGRSNLAQIFKEISRGEREILRYINLMKTVLSNFSTEIFRKFNEKIQVQKIYEMNQYLFDSIIAQLNKGEVKRLSESLLNAEWKTELHKELEQPINSAADKLLVDLFIFSAEQLLIQLKKMNVLIIKV